MEVVKIFELLEGSHVENVSSKEWGYEKWIVNERGICLKIMVLYPGYECSEHHHRSKFEAFFILDGPAILTIDGRRRTLERGDLVKIGEHSEHSFRALEETAAILEVSTQHFEEDSFRSTVSHFYNLGGKKLEETLGIVGRFREANILLLGDFMTDEWYEGPASRLSPEGPCPIVENPSETATPGGAGNTAINLAALGAKVHAVGVCGDDFGAGCLVNMLSDAGVCVNLVRDSHRPTTRKLRVMSGSHHHVRLDWEVKAPIPKDIEERVLTSMVRILDKEQIGSIVISDYAKGGITPELMHSVMRNSKRGDKPIPVVVDPRSQHWDWYNRPDIIKPNLKCLEALLGHRLVTEDSIWHGAWEACQRVSAQYLVLTRGSDGLTVVGYGVRKHFPAKLAEVAELSGAGDTVTAILGIGAAIGLDIGESARIANIAGSLVVRKTRTATLTPTELASAIREATEDGQEETQKPPQA